MPTGEIPTGAAGATGAVMESDYNANTILAATADNTPAALTVGASTIVGRKASGDISAMSAAEAIAVMGLGTAATTAATAYATAAQGSTADTAVQPARSISTTAPLTGGGDLSANRTLAVSAASDTAAGVVELATSAETVTGTDTARAVTPAGAVAAFTQLAQAFNAQTGTTYTLVAGDAGKCVSLSNASAITLTLPQDSDATISVGATVDLYQLGAGQVTVAAGTGATLRVSGLTAKARAQYSRLAVQKVSANTWSLFGDLAAA